MQKRISKATGSPDKSRRGDKFLGFSVLGIGLIIMTVGVFLCIVGLLLFSTGIEDGTDEGSRPGDLCWLIIGIIFVATASLCLIIFKEKREKWLSEDMEHCWRCGEPLEQEERFCFICGEQRESDKVKEGDEE